MAGLFQRLCVLSLAVIYVTARPHSPKINSYKFFDAPENPNPPPSIDDGDVNPLEEFGYSQEDLMGRGRSPQGPRQYGGPVPQRSRPRTGAQRPPVRTQPREYGGAVSSKSRPNPEPQQKRPSSKTGAKSPPAQSRGREYGGAVSSKSKPSPVSPPNKPAQPEPHKSRARPARIRPHSKGKITINGIKEPDEKNERKVHSCKKGEFQWEKCREVSRNLKCEICFPKVPLKFELCQESHRGNSKRCLEALYWMFKQRVNNVKRKYPHHFRNKQKLAGAGSDASSGGGGRISHSRFASNSYSNSRRPRPYYNSRGGQKYPEYFRGSNKYSNDNGGKYQGGMRKRV